MAFFFITGAMAVAVAAAVLWPMIRRTGPDEAGDQRGDVGVYRDQLAEIERDLDKGLLAEEEAARIRMEVSRRLLEADRSARHAGYVHRAGRQLNITVALVALVTLLGGSFFVYDRLGAAGAPDQPLGKRRAEQAQANAQRPGQAEAEAQVPVDTSIWDQAEPSYRDLVKQLRETALSRPNDARGQELLAEHEARLGFFIAAHQAKARAIALKDDAATSDDYADWAELMIIAANGYVSPEAEDALSAAVRLAPDNPRAMYYSGLLLAQTGRPDVAYRLWFDLLQRGPADAPWVPPIRAQIADLARMAGIRPPALPPAPAAKPDGGLKGPSESDVEAASQMSDADRQDMIRGMVSRLAERLDSEGGSPAEWARLISAQSVLGDTDAAHEAWQKARKALESDAAGRETVDAAAAQAGLTN